MPTYEYECSKCGRVFERFHSITAKPLRTVETDCAKCHNLAPVRRLIGTGGGVLFKGPGFYQTDYRSESYRAAAKAEKSATDGKKDSTKDSTKESAGGASKGDRGEPASTETRAPTKKSA